MKMLITFYDLTQITCQVIDKIEVKKSVASRVLKFLFFPHFWPFFLASFRVFFKILPEKLPKITKNNQKSAFYRFFDSILYITQVIWVKSQTVISIFMFVNVNILQIFLYKFPENRPIFAHRPQLCDIGFRERVCKDFSIL